MSAPLSRRRQVLERQILPKRKEPIRYSPILQASLSDLLQSVKSPRARRAGSEASGQPV